jgi:CubicO group peptidase (beta-lactamase class C family)
MWLSRRASMNGMRILGIVAAFGLCGCSDRLSTTRVERDAALAADVQAFATRLAARDEFSGVVLITHHGQPLVRQGYRFADRMVGRPNTPETPFMLSSVGGAEARGRVPRRQPDGRRVFDG